ncbi:hypothetical protein E8E14_014747 [Neopestalotiopsis sp. 37M]|nr:hypothetical protein E8E14_014747 [Neopestalotiopsis sp. 37M]
MTAALINGLSNEEEVLGPVAPFSCPSGNCTWVPYSTLAICSACNDVTASLKKTESFNISELDPLRLATRGTSLPYVRSYALPYINLTDYPYFMVGGYVDLDPVNMTAAVVSDPGLTVSFKTSNTLIAAVGIIRTPPVYNQTNWWESSPSATECALHFCTKAYTARVDKGELNESEIGTWSNRNPQSYALSNTIEDAGTLGGDEGSSDKSLTGWAESPRYDLQLRISEEEAQQKGLPENATRVFNISQSSAITASYAVTNQLFFSGGIKWPMPRQGPDGP